MKISFFLILFLSILLFGCSLDYEPDCDYAPPATFELIRNVDGKYLIVDHSDERAEHVIFPRGMNVPPVNIFESETFEDSCSAKGFMKSELEKFNRDK